MNVVVAGRGALIKFPDGSECSLGAVKSGLLNVDVHNGGLQSQAAAFADHVMNDICGVKGACSTMEAEIYKTACGMIYDELGKGRKMKVPQSGTRKQRPAGTPQNRPNFAGVV